ncbi:hypothetical protein LOTGIDRAFT_162916 [Lottia gigantea]|uniref:Sushi, von Willebrand factor type A, EGF and pentraxin domain-containing protein 1 n=1 Tax=Lottia gigantea TaxID=225164 RepID=V4A6A9_LOTGI|nr:hypothetical protein LOTGIDRAFT_162916 [Lottia gigantea]ESO92262.1 hypothetical protein LOTGIDRAFT_162916 [Lottia gigantea]
METTYQKLTQTKPFITYYVSKQIQVTLKTQGIWIFYFYVYYLLRFETNTGILFTMRLHFLVAVLVVLVLIDVGEGYYRRYYRYQGGRSYYRYQGADRDNQYEEERRYYRYQEADRDILREITIIKCLKWSIVKYIVIQFSCPKPDPCAMIDCNYKGKCVDGKCQCNTGFHGQFCSEPIPDCQNGGNLVVENGKLKCNCPLRTFGEDCSLGVCDIEGESPCLNGGTCVSAVNIADTPSCTCPPGTIQPVCELKDCGAEYTCNEGHEVASGDFSIKCLVSGQWDVANILVCQAKDCGAVPPGNFSTGTAASGTTFPNKADYTCNEGHEVAGGDFSIKCLASGQWDVANILVCQATNCGAVPPGNFSTGTAASGTTYPNKADYTCNEGHEVASGDISIKCLATGQWDVANILVCQAKDCGAVPPGNFSTGTAASGTTYPNKAEYTCDEGHEEASGDISIKCLASGQWDVANILVCNQVKDCEAVPPGNFSTGTAASGTTYPNKADYTCNEGHEVASGDFSIKCLASGQWNVVNILVCRAKDCGAVPPGNFSTGTAASGTTYPNEADYTCDEGHEVASGDFSIKCLESGQWDVANILVCQAKDCGDLPPGTLSTGRVNGGSTFPNTANYTCDEGHERESGKTEISCLASGQWETDVLVCKPKYCGSIPNGFYSYGNAPDNTFPNKAEFKCMGGFVRVSGKTEISCLASGKWETDVLVCKGNLLQPYYE